MAWAYCEPGCGHMIRQGLRRHYDGAGGQPLADGRTCWRCRAKDATASSRKRAKERAAEDVRERERRR